MQEAVKGVGGCERWKEAVKKQETCGGGRRLGREGKKTKEDDRDVEGESPEPGRAWGIARRKGELTRWLGRWGSRGLNKHILGGKRVWMGVSTHFLLLCFEYVAYLVFKLFGLAALLSRISSNCFALIKGFIPRLAD